MNRTGLAIALAIAVAVGVIFAVWRGSTSISPRCSTTSIEDIHHQRPALGDLLAPSRPRDRRARRRAGFSRCDRQDDLAAPAHADRRPRRLVSRGDLWRWALASSPTWSCRDRLAPAAPDRCHRVRRQFPLHAMVGSAGALRRQLFLRLRRAVGRLLDRQRRRWRRRNTGRSPMAPRSPSAPASGLLRVGGGAHFLPTWSLPACSCALVVWTPHGMIYHWRRGPAVHRARARAARRWRRRGALCRASPVFGFTGRVGEALRARRSRCAAGRIRLRRFCAFRL